MDESPNPTRLSTTVWRPFGDEPKAPRGCMPQSLILPGFQPITNLRRQNSDLRTQAFSGGGNGGQFPSQDASLRNIHPYNDSLHGYQNWFPCDTTLYSPRRREIMPRSPRLLPIFDGVGEERARTAAWRRVISYRRLHEPFRQRVPERVPALPLHHISMINSGKLKSPSTRGLPFAPHSAR